MNKPSIGVKTWGTATNNNQNKKSYDSDLPKIPYVKWQKGLNNLRIVSDIGVFSSARWKGPKSKSRYGDRIRTAYPAYEDCPAVTKLKLNPKERFKFLAISRADNTLRLYEVGQLVIEQVEASLEVKNSVREDGDKVTPRDFDISIKFNPDSDNATGFYNVVAHDSIPMKQSDLDIIEDVGGQDIIDRVLQAQITCPKPESVEKWLKRLGWDGEAVKDEESEEDSKSASKETLEAPAEDDYTFAKPEETEAAANE